MDHVGIDVCKKESQVSILTPNGEITEVRIATTRERFREVLGGRPRARVLIETSTESEVVGEGETTPISSPILGVTGTPDAPARVTSSRCHAPYAPARGPWASPSQGKPTPARAGRSGRVSGVVARPGVEELWRGQGPRERRPAGVEAEVVEDAFGDQGLRDEGDDLETAAAGRAGEDIHGEDLLEEVSPGEAVGRGCLR
jgi:hypothetical protein